jgi:hypothetical protein
MELGKPRCPSTWEEGLRVQNHVAKNAQCLSNPLAHFCHNEQKAIVRTKRHALLEWDRLYNDLQYRLEVPKPALVKLALATFFDFLA